MVLRGVVPPLARREALRRCRGQGVGVKDEATVRRETAECLEALDALLEPGPYLVGDTLSRADIAVAATVDQMRIEALTPELARAVEAHPRVITWLDRVHADAPPAN